MGGNPVNRTDFSGLEPDPTDVTNPNYDPIQAVYGINSEEQASVYNSGGAAIESMGVAAMAGLPDPTDAFLLFNGVWKLGHSIVGAYSKLRYRKLKDAHHIIQDAAMTGCPGYKSGRAPTIQLKGPSTAVGSPHYNATRVQDQRGGGTYGAERRIAYKALRFANIDKDEARKIIEWADDYFSSIGVTPNTPTRIPGNRKR